MRDREKIFILKICNNYICFFNWISNRFKPKFVKRKNSYILNHVPKSTIDKTFTSIFIQNSIVFIWFIKDKIGKHGNYFFKSLSLKNPNFRVYDLPVALYNNTCVYYLKDVWNKYTSLTLLCVQIRIPNVKASTSFSFSHSTNKRYLMEENMLVDNKRLFL